jgi:hypothetical protein
MKVIELIQYLEGFGASQEVMLNMTTGQMDQIKFVNINFVDEVGLPNELDGSSTEIVLISHTTPGEEEEDTSHN